jgi:cytochrome c oxidase subunit 3
MSPAPRDFVKEQEIMSSTIASTLNPQEATLTQKMTGAVLAERPERYTSSGIWVGVFAITMSFAAFTSALFVREGTNDWSHLVLPSILYVNTLFLLASSGTLEMARHSLIELKDRPKASAWVALTLLLGLAFCAGQYKAWLDLRAQGIYLATNPNSSFFYLLTFMHVLHVLVGILVLVYMAWRLIASHAPFRRSLFLNTAVYWHFMGVLWVYLLLLCRMKL